MLIFQRMQILCAALLLGVSSVLVGCGSARQAPADDENLVVVYNCGAEDWTDPIAKEFQEETGIRVQLVDGTSDALMKMSTYPSRPIWHPTTARRKVPCAVTMLVGTRPFTL